MKIHKPKRNYCVSNLTSKYDEDEELRDKKIDGMGINIIGNKECENKDIENFETRRAILTDNLIELIKKIENRRCFG